MKSPISIDLHLHFDGSISLASAKRLACEQNIELPQSDYELKKMLTVDEHCSDLGEYLTKFAFPLSLLQTEASIKNGMLTLCRELINDGTVYAEIRFAPQLHTQKGLTQEQVVKAALAGFEESCLNGGLILCCMRGIDNKDLNEETVLIARDFLQKGVLALDLAGNEAKFSTISHKYIFELASKNGIPFTVHAGEADGPQSVKDAILFGASRIGHGVRAIENQELIAELINKNIPLELCPTSNVNTAIFDKISSFPVRRFMDEGVTVTINSDNRSVSDTTAGKELELLKKNFGLTDKEEKTLLLNSVSAAFCSEKIKENLRKMISERYE